MISSLPICFHSMKKIILDDDQAFSQSILLKLNKRNFIPYYSPKEALNFLLQDYQPSLTKADLISKDSFITNSSLQHMINLNIEKMKTIILEWPFDDISVVLVDYHMPDMLGTDFLREIQHLPIKKALITGKNEYKIAVDAFELKIYS